MTKAASSQRVMMSLIHLWVLFSESQQAVGSWVSSVELHEAYFLTWKSCSPCSLPGATLVHALLDVVHQAC